MIRHCKICQQAEFGPVHILERELDRACNEKLKYEMRNELEAAHYWASREDKYRSELFTQVNFSGVGWHEFEMEDNLDLIERLAKEKGLV